MMVIPIFLYTLVLVSFNNMIGAYVPISQLRVRGTTSSFAINNEGPSHKPFQQPSSPVLRKQTISCWRRQTKALYSSTKDKSSLENVLLLDNEEERDDNICIEDTSYQLEMGSTNNSTNSNNIISESSPPSAQLFGIPIQSVILLNLVAVIWGTQHAVIKGVLSSGDSNAAYFTLARFSLAALLASPYTPGINRSDDKLSQQSTIDTFDRESIRLAWRYGIELGLYMFLGFAFQAIGLETTTASRSGFLLYLNVKFVPFFSYFIFGKRIQLSTWISALVAFGGTALLALDNNNSGGNGLEMAFTVGDLWSIAAASVSALFILRMETASKAVPNSAELNAANLWTVALLSAIWTFGLSYQSIDADSFDAIILTIQQTFQQTWSTIISHPIPLIYLGGVTTALANFIQSKASKDISAERASVIYAMDPVYGAIFANILLGETLGGMGLAGASLIVAAAATNAFLDFSGDSIEETKEKI